MEKCDQCGKEFETAEALQHHTGAKHAVQKKEDLKLKKTHLIAAVIVILIVAGGYYFYSLPPAPPGQYDNFAKCITEKGALFYGAFWCPHCQDQKKEFGSSLQYVNYIECSTPDGNAQTQECSAAGITSYPTWIFADNSRVTGVMSLSDLASKTNCTV